MSDATEVTGVRQRTRAAIVDAAVRVWARDWSASLGEIAEAATVSRSTLHRYFAERQDLVEAAYTRAMTDLEESYDAATHAPASAREELEEMMRGTIAVGDAVIFLFSDPERFSDRPGWDDDDQHADLIAVIRRAQEEEAIARDVAPEWVVGVFYSLIYVAAEAINSGHLPRHRAGEVAARTFFGGVGATG